MGCGKSSVGRELSELLCCRFTDLDALIEEQAGCSIPEIFERSGEKEFRRMEADTLRCLLEEVKYLGRSLRSPHHCASQDSTPLTCTEHYSSSPVEESSALILALGGGAVMTPECAEMVHESTFCVYLRTSVDELVSRLSGEASSRPLLASYADEDSHVETGHASSCHTGNEDFALRSRILELMSLRAETYERVAHLVVDTDGKSIVEVARIILDRLGL